MENDKVQELIKERDEFLKQHPNLQEFQDGLDELLNKTPPENRLESLSLMMTWKLTELQSLLIKLVRVLNDHRVPM